MKLEKGDISNAILASIKIAGLLTIAALAPNAIQMLGLADKGKRLANTKYYIKTTIGKLHKQGLIEFKDDGEIRHVILSKKGELRLVAHQKLGLNERLRERWDGKWRIVMFDIKECTRPSRDSLRDELTNLGFIKIQNSVWVFPHDCEEFIFLLKTDFELGKNVLYMTVEKLENDKWLRKLFGLPLMA